MLAFPIALLRASALCVFLVAASGVQGVALTLDEEAIANATFFANHAFAHPDKNVQGDAQGTASTCQSSPHSYFMGPSVGSDQNLVEFNVTEGPVIPGRSERGPFALYKLGLSPVDIANGVQWRGVLLLYYNMSREHYWLNGAWRLGVWQANHTKEMVGTQLDGSNPIAELEYMNGRWYAIDQRATGRLSSFADTNPQRLGYLGVISLQNLLEYLNATLGGWNRLKQLVDDIDQPGCNEIDTPGRRNRLELLKALPNREVTGTMADFIAAFPGFLRQASNALEIDERDYLQEQEFILRTALKCGQITTAMMSDVAVTNGPSTYPDFKKLGVGQEYAACQGQTWVTSQLNATDKDRDLGIELDVRPSWNKNDIPSAGFTIEVSFVSLNGGGPPPHLRDTRIAYARTYCSASSAAIVKKEIQAAEHLRQLGDRKLIGSLDEFETAFPNAVRNGATAMSLNPEAFRKDIELLGQTVRMCVTIPQDVIRRLPRREYGKGHYFPPDVRDLPPTYDLCKPGLHDISSLVRSYDKENDRGLVLIFSSLSGMSGTWGDAAGFKALVYFSTLWSETATPDSYFGSFGILDAEIHSDWGASTVLANGSHQESAKPPFPPPDPNAYIRLTPTNSSATRQAYIYAPGAQSHNYNIFTIDTRDFPNGGLLSIDISLSNDSRTSGSFDLFPADVPIPTHDRPVGTLSGKYDVFPGTSTRLQYRFTTGRIFAFGLEGNWASPKGNPGGVEFRVTVHP